MLEKAWEVPNFTVTEFSDKEHKYCVCVPVINEGEKIIKQLKKMSVLSNQIDIILLDGGSTDGSLEHAFLKKKWSTCSTC